MHRSFFIGDFREGSKTQTRFLRNDDGEYDPESGSYRESKMAIQVNYSKDGCFSFGVALVAPNGNETGVGLKPFNYTDKRVLSINDVDKKVKAEICRVRSLERTNRIWVSHSRADGELYLDDPVSKVLGVGKSYGISAA